MGSKTKVKTKRKKTEEKVSSKSSKKRKAKQKQNEKESRKRKLESSKKSSKSKSSKKMKKTPTDYRNILGLADKDRPGMSEEKKLRFVLQVLLPVISPQPEVLLRFCHLKK